MCFRLINAQNVDAHACLQGKSQEDLGDAKLTLSIDPIMIRLQQKATTDLKTLKVHGKVYPRDQALELESAHLYQKS